MEFRILGPLEAFESGRAVPLGGAKQRALLEFLLLHAGETVSTDRLIDAVWGESPPSSASNSVHIYVSRLRRALGNGRVATRPGGYALEIEHDELDLREFEGLVAAGKELLSQGESEAGRARLSAAVGLWRGAPVTELAATVDGQVESERLVELRLAAVEECVEAELACGHAADVVPELERLVRQHPFRERLRGQLMLALYRTGRQVEALEIYRQGRRVLSEELGLEPGPSLQELEHAILSHDPKLEPASMLARVTARRGPLLVVASAAVLLLAAVGVSVQLVREKDGVGLASLAANSVGVIDAETNRIVAQIPVGVRPGPLVAGNGAVWIANLEDSTVSRLDPDTKALVRTISTPSVPTGLAVDDGRVWVAGSDGSLSWIDPRYNRVTKTAAKLEKGLFYRTPDHPVAVGFGSVWASDSIGQVERVDRSTGKVVSRIDVGSGANGLVVGAGSVWVANTASGTVSRIDPTGVVTATIPVGHGPTGIAFGEGSVWVAVSLDGVVARINPATDAVSAVILAGVHPQAVAVGLGAVWAADGRGGHVFKIDPASNEITKTVELGSSPRALAVVGNSLWTTVTALAPLVNPDAGGEILLVEVESDPGVVDPAVSVNPQLDYATCATLLNYPDLPAPAGSQLVPEVAQSIPVVSRDGLRYTFIVRSGFVFSPPSNERVTAKTFKDTIERALDPRLRSEAAPMLADVVGAKAYMAGRAEHITGIVATSDKLTVRLVRPAGDLPARISTPYFCAVPSGTPVDPDGVRDIPMAGPYHVASYVPGQELILKRNPNYAGDRPQGPAEIHYTIGVSRDRTMAHILAGRVDYAGDGVPLAAQKGLLRRFGPGSPAGKRGRQQFFVNSVLSSRFIVLNTRRSLFADVRLRRAVNYAIDRAALARVWKRFFESHTLGGGPPTADYLSPSLRVSSTSVGYPLHPDLERARGLAGNERRTAVLFTCDEPPCPQHAEIVKANLAAIGIDVVVKAFPVAVMFARAAEPGAAYDLLRVGWGAEYADPAAILEPLLRGGSVFNFSHLDDPEVNRRLDAARRLTGPARARAYEALARSIASDVAPLVAFENDTYRDLFSQRVGCQVSNPVYGMDLAALCFRS